MKVVNGNRSTPYADILTNGILPPTISYLNNTDFHLLVRGEEEEVEDRNEMSSNIYHLLGLFNSPWRE